MMSEVREEVAIVGMAGRFPGASSVAQLWENLCAGVESIRPFTAEELAAAGVDPGTAAEADYVAAGAPLEDADAFDAAFFGYNKREAEIMDPQHRVFLECSWQALEDAGYDPVNFTGRIGVFGGVAPNTYRQKVLETRPDVMAMAGRYPLLIGSEREYAITRSAFKLGLEGPAISVNTACSTSGVALHLACLSVLSGETDMALAGGARVAFPQTGGYFYEEDGILSPDGHCRAFDAEARGTVVGSGVAIVVVKRLSDALRDGDRIWALVKGTAINNDGSDKIGYTAPGVHGQEQVIREALDIAEVDPSTIGYVEAHGTGTFIGDPIEVEALTRAYRHYTDATGYCGLGSIKTNIGHLDAGAGVAGVIKAVLALDSGRIPPSLHYQEPNPQIDFAASPFRVVDRLTEWPADLSPRRAAVSSFGLGGTNAHIVLEEAPRPQPTGPSRRTQHLFPISAHTLEALDRATARLADHLQAHADLEPADVAHTLIVGRRPLPYRRVVAARKTIEAAEALERLAGRPVTDAATARPVLFMFPGGGAQHQGMAARLYAEEPEFRRWFDRCAEMIGPRLGADLRELVYGSGPVDLERPTHALASLFATEYALARLLGSLGVEPDFLIGHSMGEYTAACLAGVMSLEDALALVTLRGELFETLPPGGMLSVPLAPADLERHLNEDLSVAVVNKPDLCIVAGETEAIDRLESDLGGAGIETRKLHIGVAAHSHLVDPILDRFGEFASSIDFGSPSVPIISNLTGEVLAPEIVTSPQYWVDHLRGTVRFVDGLRTALSGSAKLAIEVGPGQTLSGFARQHPDRTSGQVVAAALPHPKDETPDDLFFFDAVGKMWAAGGPVDLTSLYRDEERRRVTLPTYPFERTRYWIDPGQPAGHQGSPIQAVPAPPPPQPAEAAEEPKDRRSRIFDRIIEVLGELSGLSAGELDPHATFLELGFDSLFMTQAASAIGASFGTRISFRQMFEEAPTVSDLSGWLDASLPEDAFPAPAPQPTPTQSSPADQPAGLAAISAQLEELQRQVASLAGGSPAPVRTTPEAGRTAPSETTPSAPSGPWRPPEKRSDALEDAQRRHIEELTARLTGRAPSSKQKTQEDRSHLADPRTVAGFRRVWKEIVFPVVVDRSAGSRVWDIDGNEYIDVAMGFGVNLFGHSPSFVIEAVQSQLERGIEIGPQTPLAGETARLIADMTGHERVAFCNTGSEAVLAAMRLARTATGRTKILTFANDYHGLFDEVLARGVTSNGTRRSIPIAPGIPGHAPQEIVIFEYGDPEALEFIAAHASELAAVLVEPVQSRHPDLQPVDFLRQLRQVTSDTDVALIFDEMITGFRSHPGGAQALFDVRADLATYGKVIGGGFPIGVVAGDARYMDGLDGGHWSYGDDSIPEADVTWFAGTFVRHPVALAASRAALLHMQREGEGLQAGLNRRTTDFVEGLNDFLTGMDAPMRVEHFSSLFLTRFENDQEFSSLFYFHLRDQGIHITEGRAAFLSTAHSDEDLERIGEAYKNSVRALADAGFISRGSRPAAAPAARELGVTEGQQEILLAAVQDDESNAAYNLSNTLHIRGPVDLATLNAAVNALIARHDSLRVTFDPDMTRQRIAAKLEIDVTFVDLTSLDPVEADAALDQERTKDVETPFDLVEGPLVRARLIKRGENDHHLFLTVHHAVCDGWSSGTLLRRLAELYTAIRRGEDADLPPAMSLVEYVDWFEQYRSSDDYETDKDFWVEYVGTQFPVTDLPADRPRPPVKQTASERTTRRIDDKLLEGLRSMAAAEGVTLFTLLLGSFECLLARLSDQDEVGLAVSIAGHTRFANRDLVAHAVNALPLRRPVARDGSFSDHLATTRTAFFDAFEHQDFSYGAIVRHTGAGRDPRRTPLVSTTFNMDSPSGALDMDGATAVPGSNPRNHEIFDAFINVVPHDDHLIIECTYDVALFARKTIDRRLEEWTTMLEGLVAAGPDVSVSQVGIVPEADLELIRSWNSTEVDFGPPATIVSLLEDTARTSPDSVAVISGDVSLTYSELEHRAENVASGLSALGVGRGSIVGVLCRPSVGMLTGIHGVLKAGAAYVPLDPDYPSERIGQVLEETRMQVVLSQDEFRHLFDGGSVTVIDVEASDFGDADAAVPGPRPEVDPNDVAYVIYTSGSTGRPKGVMVKHHTVVNLLRWLERDFDTTRSDRLLLTKPIVFDASVVELFGAVTAGAGLVIPDSDPTDPALLVQTIIEHDVSILQLVPSMLGVFLHEPRVAECRTLRTVVSGGEPLSPELCSRFYEVLDAQLENHYGPTETTVIATAFRCGPETAHRPTVPIGGPLDNVRIHILDRGLSPVPVGVVGEVCIAGAQVAAGYLDRPELTAERFVEEPGTDGEPMYRTGDLGRWLPDGTIEYLGRGDTQIKLRGYRIELGEIEARLSEHPDVTSAAVIVGGVDEGRHLVAYVSGAEPRVDDLKVWLRSRVPPYMIPTAWAVLDRMPTTVSGKIDRRSLPKLEGSQDRGASEFIAPSTPIEEEIAGIWAEVIGIDRVGTKDDFFDLGGHSLTAMQANARLRAAYDVEITLADFRTHSTVGDQALLVTQLLASEQMDDELMAAVLALGSTENGGSES